MFTIEEFNQLELMDQLCLLLEQGTCLGSKKENKFTTTLFHLFGFYVEIWRHSRFSTIHKLVITEEKSLINQYLLEIDLENLY